MNKSFKKTFNLATKKAAASAFKEMQRLHKEFPDPEMRDYKAIGRLLDKAAVLQMREVFENQSEFYVEIKGSEGRKDTKRDGIESPDLYGSYGPTNGVLVELVNDAVEGTKFASRNEPCATSVLAAVLDQKNGLMATGNFDYMSKLFGPPQVKGKISLELSPAENFQIALKELQIKDPKQLAVVILDRPRNQFIIESAQELGLSTILIPGGDLTPCLLAASDPKILKTIKSKKIPDFVKGVLVMGSGGWEEGVIAAAGAKALGGHVQGRVFSDDAEAIEQAKILEADDLVPAMRSSILVSVTAITDDPWFGVSGVDSKLKTRTISITESGIDII